MHILNYICTKIYAGVAQLVEHHLAKVDVEGSNPFARSIANFFLLIFSAYCSRQVIES